MTNYEYYKNEIEKFAKLNIDFALDKHDKGIARCAGFDCNNCVFDCSKGYCADNKMAWADAEHVEGIDWSKVPVDTPILVKEVNSNWLKRHFAKYENGKVYAFIDGGTSWSSECQYLSWGYAKLAEGDNGI